jgi:hypothetical protein
MYLTRAVNLLPTLANALREGKRQEVMQEVVSLIEGLQYLQILFDAAASFIKIKENWRVDKEPATIILERFHVSCYELIEALEQQDYILLGDLMEFSLPQGLQDYNRLFGALQEWVLADAGTAAGDRGA